MSAEKLLLSNFELAKQKEIPVNKQESIQTDIKKDPTDEVVSELIIDEEPQPKELDTELEPLIPVENIDSIEPEPTQPQKKTFKEKILNSLSKIKSKRVKSLIAAVLIAGPAGLAGCANDTSNEEQTIDRPSIFTNASKINNPKKGFSYDWHNDVLNIENVYHRPDNKPYNFKTSVPETEGNLESNIPLEVEAEFNLAPEIPGLTKVLIGKDTHYLNEAKEDEGMFYPDVYVDGKRTGGVSLNESKIAELYDPNKQILPITLIELGKSGVLKISEVQGYDTSLLVEFDQELNLINPFPKQEFFSLNNPPSRTKSFTRKSGDIVTFNDVQICMLTSGDLSEESNLDLAFFITNSSSPEITESRIVNSGELLNFKADSCIIVGTGPVLVSDLFSFENDDGNYSPVFLIPNSK